MRVLVHLLLVHFVLSCPTLPSCSEATTYCNNNGGYRSSCSNSNNEGTYSCSGGHSCSGTIGVDNIPTMERCPNINERLPTTTDASMQCNFFLDYCKKMDSMLVEAKVENGLGTYRCQACKNSGDVTGGVKLDGDIDFAALDPSNIPIMVWVLMVFFTIVCIAFGYFIYNDSKKFLKEFQASVIDAPKISDVKDVFNEAKETEVGQELTDKAKAFANAKVEDVIMNSSIGESVRKEAEGLTDKAKAFANAKVEDVTNSSIGESVKNIEMSSISVPSKGSNGENSSANALTNVGKDMASNLKSSEAIENVSKVATGMTSLAESMSSSMSFLSELRVIRCKSVVEYLKETNDLGSLFISEKKMKRSLAIMRFCFDFMLTLSLSMAFGGANSSGVPETYLSCSYFRSGGTTRSSQSVIQSGIPEVSISVDPIMGIIDHIFTGFVGLGLDFLFKSVHSVFLIELQIKESNGASLTPEQKLEIVNKRKSLEKKAYYFIMVATGVSVISSFIFQLTLDYPDEIRNKRAIVIMGFLLSGLLFDFVDIITPAMKFYAAQYFISEKYLPPRILKLLLGDNYQEKAPKDVSGSRVASI